MTPKQELDLAWLTLQGKHDVPVYSTPAVRAACVAEGWVIDDGGGVYRLVPGHPAISREATRVAHAVDGFLLSKQGDHLAAKLAGLTDDQKRAVRDLLNAQYP